MRDVLARGDMVKSAAGVAAWQLPPDPDEEIILWDSSDHFRSAYHDAMQLSEMVLVIVADRPSKPEGVIFEGSMDGVNWNMFVETDTLVAGEDFEKQYRPRTPHVRIRYKNAAGPPLGVWNMSLGATIG